MDNTGPICTIARALARETMRRATCRYTKEEDVNEGRRMREEEKVSEISGWKRPDKYVE